MCVRLCVLFKQRSLLFRRTKDEGLDCLLVRKLSFTSDLVFESTKGWDYETHYIIYKKRDIVGCFLSFILPTFWRFFDWLRIKIRTSRYVCIRAASASTTLCEWWETWRSFMEWRNKYDGRVIEIPDEWNVFLVSLILNLVVEITRKVGEERLIQLSFVLLISLFLRKVVSADWWLLAKFVVIKGIKTPDPMTS